MGSSDGSGNFGIERDGFTAPADCTVDVNDGSATPANARLSGCTVTTPPPTTTTAVAPTTTPPYRWSVVAGQLPPGLSPTTSPGRITGTPTTAGAFTFTPGSPTTAASKPLNSSASRSAPEPLLVSLSHRCGG